MFGASATAAGTEGRERTRVIAAMALPIVGGMASQNVLNLVDTAMVGSLGTVALASVGIGSFANFIAIAFVMGLSAAVQAMASRRLGEGRVSRAALPLNGALVVAGLIGAPVSAVFYLIAPSVFPYLNGDAAVVQGAVPYFQIRVLAVVAVGVNFAFRGFWNGINRPGLYLRTLVLMHASNVVLSLGFIFGHFGLPALGVEGAALGSTLATYIGAAYYLLMGWRHARENGFLGGLPAPGNFRRMVSLAGPSSLQQLLFAIGHMVLFWIIGQVGTEETAAAHVLVHLMLVAILPGMALGLTAASLVGQSLGRGRAEEARRWAWSTVRLGALVMGLLGLPMLLAPEAVLGVFIHEASTVEVARVPLQMFGAYIGVDALGVVLMHALLGAGASRAAMAVSVVFQWGVFLPLAYLFGPVLGIGLTGIWAVQLVYRALQSAAFVVLWRRGRWATIRV